jgi:3-phenylpropionate/trans-cinnamate dioxygenase ferredoxin reductase subunit
MRPTFIIVGGSLAGATAAMTLRQDGFEGRVILVGDEGYPPYERPALSKQYLRGEITFEKMLVRPAAFYHQHRIDTLFGVRATGIDTRSRTVDLNTGQRLHYHRVLVATGARNRRLSIPGSHLQGIHRLRSVADAAALRAEIAAGRRAVVVGMGFVGSEVAASLRLKGVHVTTVDPSPSPLFHIAGAEVGHALAALHREHGVDTLFDDVVTKFDGARRVETVSTRSGRIIACDFAVVGVGVEPAVDLAAGSGIATNNGIVVDEYCCSSVPDVYAAGDVANHYHPLFRERLRVEHWQNALGQGAAAARNMLGQRLTYEPVHWFWSDQYDVNLQYAGVQRAWDRIVVRGSLEQRDFLACYLSRGRLDAVIGVNRAKDVQHALGLIRSRTMVDPDALADDDVDLRRLVPDVEVTS